MRYSSYFIHTLFEVPKEAETPSHIFLLRGCYIYPVAAGVYSLLPLGHRVAEKVKNIHRGRTERHCRDRDHHAGVNPAELWKKTKRYYDIGAELIRLKDRKDRVSSWFMTNEETVTDIAKHFLRSYRDLPVMSLLQYQDPRRSPSARRIAADSRVLHERCIEMFSPDFADIHAYYPKFSMPILRIFARCGVESIPIQADSG